MPKLKKRGFILFSYYNRQIESFDYCKTIKELRKTWWGDYDDKWDVDGRHKIHYFYLNLRTGKYHALDKWKHNYDPTLGYDQKKEQILSTKTF